MWSKLVKVGSPVFFVTNSNKPVCHHLTVYKVGRKYFYAKGVEGLSAHVDIQVERETGYTPSYGTVHESEAVYNQKKNRENLIGRIRGFACDYGLLKSLTDQQLEGIAAILWPDIQSADVVKNDDFMAQARREHSSAFNDAIQFRRGFLQVGGESHES